jgi:aminotransferase
MIADACQEFDLLCIADEVYEHYVINERTHLSIATLDGMAERTITVNSFSKSWNISGWRLGYVYGEGRLIAPLNNANNVFYVCSPTPLQRGLGAVLMSDPQYYLDLRERFTQKRAFATDALQSAGFQIYDSGSAFYVWARIPPRYQNSTQVNEILIENGVAGVPGSAFADLDVFENYMRFCIAREDAVLQSAFGKLQNALSSRA